MPAIVGFVPHEQDVQFDPRHLLLALVQIPFTGVEPGQVLEPAQGGQTEMFVVPLSAYA